MWLDGSSPRSRLARLLLDQFIEAKGRPFPSEALGRTIWPEVSDYESRRTRLKVAVHRLRAAGFPVVYFNGGYAVDPAAEIVDLGGAPADLP